MRQATREPSIHGVPRRRRRRVGVALLSALLPAGLAGLLILAEPMPVRALRDLVFDSYQRLAPRPYDPAAPVRVIDIDEESLARLGQWPWPRVRLAELVDRLREAGAAAIALDILLAEPDRATQDVTPSSSADGAPGDGALSAALGKSPTVVSLALTDMATAPPPVKAGLAAAGDDPARFLPRFAGAVVALPAFVEAARGIGALNWVPDRDLVVRRVPTLLSGADRPVPSLAIEALRVAQDASTIVVKASNASGETGFGQQTGVTAVRVGEVTVATERDGGVRVRYAGSRPERHISAWRVLDGSADLAPVAGAILFVGASAAALADVRATPLEATVPGVDIHAEFIEHALSGSRLARPDYAPGAEAVITLLACLAIAAVASVLHPLVAAPALIALAGLIAGGSWMAFSRAELLFDPTMPLAATTASFGAATVAALRRAEEDKRRIREAFGRYVSPAIVEALAADPSQLALGGEIRPITVLFADIRGFTSRAETMRAEEVVSFLNAVHTPLADEVMRFNGTIDKFMGDGLMAFWNAPLDEPDHVRQALRAALAMQRAVAALDERLRVEGQVGGGPRLAVGIGLHTGPACVGNLGSLRRFDYSAVGDTVNTAARIEQASKTYGVPVIVSEDVARLTPEWGYLLVDSVRLRGRQIATRLYALHGPPEAVDENFARFRAQHDAAIEAALQRLDEGFVRLGEAERHPMGGRYSRLYAYHWEQLKSAGTRGAERDSGAGKEIIF
ncbi:adenylate/guanylate cyclase domain-containing protein [Chelatococcus sp. SYSU_G07232]|uniref:Adenylate/guanylate cyclase domain-containing protein n=1 Tax=Chelatococcus albus TaxID=3047466 RepID=A0ABT7AD68_9HYPH|nr:adenylate/guanylate cyclase domain-containing protein [Chelatococcus sp. SYSU_G07232]MDJ1157015.1 adenylate/guanylate cyclase domain-containing protein [Chelatococcus sp. SYSU_G07232]